MSTLYLLFLTLVFPSNGEANLERLGVKSCEEVVECSYYPKMIRYTQFSDSIIIGVRVNENCIFSEPNELIGYSEVFNDSLIVGIKQRMYEINPEGDTVSRPIPVAMCECNYEFEFTISRLKQKEYRIYYQGQSEQSYVWRNKKLNYQSERYEIIGNDTINRFDIYGFRQGYHNHNSYKIDYPSISEKDYGIFEDNMVIEWCVYDSLGNQINKEKLNYRLCE